MATVIKCDHCKNVFDVDETTELRVEQTRVPIFQLDLCDECLNMLVKTIGDYVDRKPLTEEEARNL